MFQFFFQSGEFVGESSDWSKDLLLFIGNAIVQFIAILLGASIAAKYALKQYQRQFDDNEKTKDSDKRKLYYEKLLFLNHMINSVEQFIESVSKSVEQVDSQIKSDQYSTITFSTFPYDDLLRAVEHIDRETIFHAHISIVGSSNIISLFTNLDILNRTRINLEHEILSHQNNILNQKKDLIKGLNQTSNLIVKIQTIKQIDRDQKDNFKLILARFYELGYSLDVSNFEELKDEFFYRIIDNITSNYDLEGLNIAEVLEIFHLSTENILRLESIEKQNIDFVNRIRDYSSKFSRLGKYLKDDTHLMRNKIARIEAGYDTY